MRITGPGRAVLALVVLVALSAGVAAASPAGQDAYVGRHPLAGGVLATLDVEGERFRVWITNPDAVRQVLALERGTRTASIPNGKLRFGPGRAGHNAPWHWHLDPRDIELADFTIELCDATPSYVEAHRREFVRTVGRFCPWSAQLVDVKDFR